VDRNRQTHRLKVKVEFHYTNRKNNHIYIKTTDTCKSEAYSDLFALDIRKEKSNFRNIINKMTHLDLCQFLKFFIDIEVTSYDFRWNLYILYISITTRAATICSAQSVTKEGVTDLLRVSRGLSPTEVRGVTGLSGTNGSSSAW
jgi:hypothetical protein